MEAIIAQRRPFGRHVAISHTKGTTQLCRPRTTNCEEGKRPHAFTAWLFIWFGPKRQAHGLFSTPLGGPRHELLLNVELVLRSYEKQQLQTGLQLLLARFYSEVCSSHQIIVQPAIETHKARAAASTTIPHCPRFRDAYL